MAAEPEEIKPSWVEYPGFGPGDGNWMQGVGESFMFDVWEHYYESLSEPEQEAYLQQWNVSDDWYRMRFDKEFQAILDQTNKEYLETHPVIPWSAPMSRSKRLGRNYGLQQSFHLLKQLLCFGRRKL